MSLEFKDSGVCRTTADNRYAVWEEYGRWLASYVRADGKAHPLGDYDTRELAEAACNKHENAKFTLGGG